MAKQKKNSKEDSTKKKTSKKKSNNTNTKKETIDFDRKLMTIVENGNEKHIPLNNKQIAELLYGRKMMIKAKNKKQKDLIKEIDKNQITFAVGPAGTGKSFISVAKALELIANPDNNYQKIYVITPAVEADSSIGYLKGSLEDKLDPYLFSTYYLMDKIIGKSNRKRLLELRIIEPLAYGFIRGISIDSSIVIAEESQNTGISQMKTLLTRLGYNSKMIISGDIEQTDRKGNAPNGLQDAIHRTTGIKDIGSVEFELKDIVRNPLISKILNKYNE
jgi:phosphate starvation-inducible PhoH-like protein